MEMHMNDGRQQRRLSQVGLAKFVYFYAANRIQLPLNPNSTIRLCWDFLGLFLISWDVLFIPYELAFDPESNLFTDMVSWIILIYWSCDVVMSNLVGFYENGELIMNFRRIFLRYLRTWFIIDVWSWVLIGSSRSWQPRHQIPARAKATTTETWIKSPTPYGASEC